MPRSNAMAHIVRLPDGSSEGVWGPYILRTALQPIFAFDEKRRLSVCAFEGLLRPFRDGLPHRPQDFFLSIPAADRFQVETISRTLHLLNAGAFLEPSMKVFVNFDPSLFGDPKLIDDVLRDMRLVLHESRLESARVVCEVTEQKSVYEAALTDFVYACRRHGFSIAVDDYGAEESGMERVVALRPDIVKFDARWIRRLMDSGPGRALLGVMVSDFHDQGIVSIFEGIEEDWQLEVADNVGADMVQGFLLARPELVPGDFGWAVAGAAGGMTRPQSGDMPRNAVRRPTTQRRSFGRR